jgi:hypothetical protein
MELIYLRVLWFGLAVRRLRFFVGNTFGMFLIINWPSNPGMFADAFLCRSNWDVEELKARKEELSKPDQLTITMNGWPFGQGGDSGQSALQF